MGSLAEIRRHIEERTDADARRVEGLWSVDCLYNPAGNGRAFKYKFLLAQTSGLGCAYSFRSHYPPEELETYLDKDFLTFDTQDAALDVAFLDSAYAACAGRPPDYSETLSGPSVAKMRGRSRIILSEAERLLGTVAGRRVVNVGVVGDILTLFSEHGAHIVGTDFDPAIVGRRLFDMVDIIDGAETLALVAESELCIATGMTIASGAIDAIIARCRANGVKLIVFAETGANLGAYYAENGADVFLGEVFPFYIFNGVSRVDVYRG
jgi:hypothetical protein